MKQSWTSWRIMIRGIYFSTTRPWIPSTDEFLPNRGAGSYIGSEVDYCYPDLDIYPICMGAGYVIRRTWFDYIRGFYELSGYGFEELLISLKSWGLGGEVRTIPGLELGHVYNSEKPKINNIRSFDEYIDNLLVSLYSLMDEEDRTRVLRHYISLGLGKVLWMNPDKFNRFKEYKTYYKLLGYDYNKFKELNALYRDNYAIKRN